MNQRGHKVNAVVLENSRLHELLKDEVSCIPLRDGLWSRLRILLGLIRNFSPNVIHVHHKKDLLLGALLKRLSRSRIKYIHTRQMDLPGNKKNPYHTFIYASMDLLIAITDRLKNQILQRINIAPQKVVRLYYGVPLPEPKNERCEELDLDSTQFNIGVIARIDHKKEQHVIIDAIDHLKTKGIDDIHVFLIGGSTDDDYLNLIQKRIEKGELNDQIKLTGFIDNPQQLMPCFDVIVLTTSIETFGLVLPEAMRMNVPVIGANGGGVPEIIDHMETGLLFEAGNAEGLAEQIVLIKDENLRKKLAVKGKEKADRLFEIEHHFDELERLFK